jgi:Transposase DDE domain group 1
VRPAVVSACRGPPPTGQSLPTGCGAVSLACDLLAWLRLLALSGDLAKAEPKTLRYRLLHTAARIVRGQRRRRLKIPHTWPWAHDLHHAFTTIYALPPP